jgi:hypothetical protein
MDTSLRPLGHHNLLSALQRGHFVRAVAAGVVTSLGATWLLTQLLALAVTQRAPDSVPFPAAFLTALQEQRSLKVAADAVTVLGTLLGGMAAGWLCTPAPTRLRRVAALLAVSPLLYAFLIHYTGDPFPHPGWGDAAWALLVAAAGMVGSDLATRFRARR